MKSLVKELKRVKDAIKHREVQGGGDDNALRDAFNACLWYAKQGDAEGVAAAAYGLLKGGYGEGELGQAIAELVKKVKDEERWRERGETEVR